MWNGSPRPLALFLLLAAAPAGASPNYPAEIQKQLGLSYTPSCAICHQNGVTGTGTVTTLFGQAMRAHGLVAGNIASLDTALAALEAEGTDSDGDGVPDIQELKNGTNPNGTGSATPPTYGCFSVTGQGPGTWSGVAWLLALAAAFGLRRRRRTRLG
jgi:MYXO-CTERM domain-containing protein